MEKTIQSKIVLLGNNIDTDRIYPGRFLALVEKEEIGSHCLEGIDESVRALVPGNIVVAGTNFGCGSSREHAVITLLAAGVKAVVAESFARIFFRNAINLGLPLVVCKGISAKVKTGQEVFIDFDAGSLKIPETGEVLETEKLGAHILSIIEAGGIKPVFLAKGTSKNIIF
jgi:3-isopropylmalate/(R)-2-methylmalate dehydratase small subunit